MLFARITRAFRPLDTSELDADIAEAAAAHQQVRVRARALRMDVSCGDAAAAIGRVTVRSANQAGEFLRRLYVVDERTPDVMHQLLGRMP